MKIARKLQPKITKLLESDTKGIIIYGPRQVGKTTLVNDIINLLQVKTLVLNGDQRGPWWEALTSRELTKLTLL